MDNSKLAIEKNTPVPIYLAESRALIWIAIMTSIFVFVFIIFVVLYWLDKFRFLSGYYRVPSNEIQQALLLNPTNQQR